MSYKVLFNLFFLVNNFPRKNGFSILLFSFDIFVRVLLGPLKACLFIIFLKGISLSFFWVLLLFSPSFRLLIWVIKESTLVFSFSFCRCFSDAQFVPVYYLCVLTFEL